ncbi:SDR family NAD(P)-dependent oxidoreductase [Dactylosporangium siamense]|uniref:3-oxoacyl-ACP reductase n=1 Tax=Dactylosporangium siamense TaxID=685454 RepID=A0A919PH10_9ACTN|nr:SDR family oxidoreductase [Dactylosporangium siamense]GIG44047.1 3-oxoacyl-ACP reductase [Dactylosporangium siamense]
MRSVIITGGATGIGYAVASAFAEAGDQVVITGRREGPLKEAAQRIGATAVAFDAADPTAVAAALPALPAHVDVLVNNAGGNTSFDRPDPADGDLEALAANWRANLDANLLSAVLVTAALAPRFTDHARIVTVGSIAARQGAGSYGAAKAAVEAWTASIASELGPRGITANVVAPGLILATEFFRDRLTDDGIGQRVAATRNGRAGAPGDVAAAVLFLAAPTAGHVTGQVVHVNGGAYLGR